MSYSAQGSPRSRTSSSPRPAGGPDADPTRRNQRTLRPAATRRASPAPVPCTPFEAIAVVDPWGRIVVSDPPTTRTTRAPPGSTFPTAVVPELERSRRICVPPEVELGPVRRAVSVSRSPLRSRTVRRPPRRHRRVGPTRCHSDPGRAHPLRPHRPRPDNDSPGQDSSRTRDPTYDRDRKDSPAADLAGGRGPRPGRISRYANTLGWPAPGGLRDRARRWLEGLGQPGAGEVEADLNATYPAPDRLDGLLSWRRWPGHIVATYVSRPQGSPATAPAPSRQAISPEGFLGAVPRRSPSWPGPSRRCSEGDRRPECPGDPAQRDSRAAGDRPRHRGNLRSSRGAPKRLPRVGPPKGAGTVAAHLVDADRTRLEPMAAYHVPKHLLEVVATSPFRSPSRDSGNRLRGGPDRLE